MRTSNPASKYMPARPLYSKRIPSQQGSSHSVQLFQPGCVPFSVPGRAATDKRQGTGKSPSPMLPASLFDAGPGPTNVAGLHRARAPECKPCAMGRGRGVKIRNEGRPSSSSSSSMSRTVCCMKRATS
ncbi:uncharacterized protein BO72DRAFT_109569 [Aspergillus fijiensis CBS 313.89]|uniref:Uncharacterized protein n=1 Tax=Aspergillus fijiensis CBS 313.89 TaxID=1448319 RepID=A0A8G1RT35_9EURO|nr:uncharacterized protein BO72DRAFT_109569 [Aspergillus fijiensis CBS 313.89]RAK77350.1 hypothetical protein BO72DRAFT_109569 [Aspergillus fijiensis CBS 313.89]